MPLLSYTLTVPPQTSEGQPVRADFIIGLRRIIRAGVLFPDGCFNAVGIALLIDGTQFAPQSGWIKGNNIYFTWVEDKASNDAGLFSIIGYSIADDYPHTPIVYLEVV